MQKMMPTTNSLGETAMKLTLTDADGVHAAYRPSKIEFIGTRMVVDGVSSLQWRDGFWQVCEHTEDGAPAFEPLIGEIVEVVLEAS